MATATTTGDNQGERTKQDKTAPYKVSPIVTNFFHGAQLLSETRIQAGDLVTHYPQEEEVNNLNVGGEKVTGKKNCNKEGQEKKKQR